MLPEMKLRLYGGAQSVEKVFFPPGRATLLLTSTCFEGAPQAVAETAEKTYPPRTVRI